MNKYLTTREAAQYIQERTKLRCTCSMVRNWCNPRRGYGRGGRKILLRATREFNDRWLTTQPWLDEFLRDIK